MSQPFGKRNQPEVRKPAHAKLHKRHLPAPALGKSRFHLYVAVSILVLILTGYALAY